MKEYLIKLGVSGKAITLDYDGFRTLDSIERAKKVFGQEKFTVISRMLHSKGVVILASIKALK